MTLSLFFGLVCFAIAIATPFWVIRYTSKPKAPLTKPPRNYPRGKAHPKRERLLGKSRAELRLSTYLFYDEKQAARLIDGIQARFPDKEREWCAEKALSDLERDRQTR